MQVDLIATGKAEGYLFYHDHLPVLGMNVSNSRTVDMPSMGDYRLDAPLLLPVNQNKCRGEIDEVIIEMSGILTLLGCFKVVFRDAIRGCSTFVGQIILKQLFFAISEH